MTFPVIQSALQVWLVASGAEKAAGLAAALATDADVTKFPAAGAIGRLRTIALIDEDAAMELPASSWRRA